MFMAAAAAGPARARFRGGGSGDPSGDDSGSRCGSWSRRPGTAEFPRRAARFRRRAVRGVASFLSRRLSTRGSGRSSCSRTRKGGEEKAGPGTLVAALGAGSAGARVSVGVPDGGVRPGGRSAVRRRATSTPAATRARGRADPAHGPRLSRGNWLGAPPQCGRLGRLGLRRRRERLRHRLLSRARRQVRCASGGGGRAAAAVAGKGRKCRARPALASRPASIAALTAQARSAPQPSQNVGGTRRRSRGPSSTRRRAGFRWRRGGIRRAAPRRSRQSCGRSETVSKGCCSTAWGRRQVEPRRAGDEPPAEPCAGGDLRALRRARDLRSAARGARSEASDRREGGVARAGQGRSGPRSALHWKAGSKARSTSGPSS